MTCGQHDAEAELAMATLILDYNVTNGREVEDKREALKTGIVDAYRMHEVEQEIAQSVVRDVDVCPANQSQFCTQLSVDDGIQFLESSAQKGNINASFKLAKVLFDNDVEDKVTSTPPACWCLTLLPGISSDDVEMVQAVG